MGDSGRHFGYEVVDVSHVGLVLLLVLSHYFEHALILEAVHEDAVLHQPIE